MQILYNLSIHLYGFAARLLSLFQPKVRLWTEGRKNLLDHIGKAIQPDDRIIWFHCASLGEFEQGRPVMEAFRQSHPSYKILLTFFSPSGYEIRKNYEGADYIFYLPTDTPSHAEAFVTMVRPSAAIFVKYEYWFNYMSALDRYKVPFYFISAIVRPEQFFFKWYGGWFRKRLKMAAGFFVQNRESHDLLTGIGIREVKLCGDTRFDRVYSIARQPRDFPLIDKFNTSKYLMVAGSTWPEDEVLLAGLTGQRFPELKLIVAPHEIHEERIQKLEQLFGQNTVRYSRAESADLAGARILIIDNIGLLSYMYRFARLAYIGGGFGKGIHNILEAATFGIPVIFGPQYQKFREARELIALGGARSIKNGDELIQFTELMTGDDSAYKQITTITSKFIQDNIGATDMIIQTLTTRLNPGKS